MDGRGRCLDNVFIERLWRSLKYEAVYLHELEDGFAAQRVIAEWIGFYNEVRPHSALGGRTPTEAYRGVAAGQQVGVVELGGRLQLQVPTLRSESTRTWEREVIHIFTGSNTPRPRTPTPR